MDYYNSIKEELINNEIYKQAKDYSKNRNELQSYYNVGKLLVEAQGGDDNNEYGNKLIEEYSKKLTREIGKGYSKRNLFYMRKFYLFQKVQTLSAQLTWSHYIELLSFDNINKINYYIRICEEQNLSVRKLREKIKLNEYERLPDNTKNKLIKQEKNNIEDFIKNPIILHNNNKEISEKVLKQIILEDIELFLEELGEGYSFIRSEYPIKYKNTYNYIDLLLFNIKYNCYIVIELKVTPLKKEHIGQIEHYMNYIDNNLKTIYQNKTIGIIITKENDEFVIKYCSNPNIISTTYEMV